jgi:hypothetical protein
MTQLSDDNCANLGRTIRGRWRTIQSRRTDQQNRLESTIVFAFLGRSGRSFRHLFRSSNRGYRSLLGDSHQARGRVKSVLDTVECERLLECLSWNHVSSFISAARAERCSGDNASSNATMTATIGSNGRDGSDGMCRAACGCNPWCNPAGESSKSPVFTGSKRLAPEHDTLGVTGSNPVAPTRQ